MEGRIEGGIEGRIEGGMDGGNCSYCLPGWQATMGGPTGGGDGGVVQVGGGGGALHQGSRRRVRNRWVVIGCLVPRRFSRESTMRSAQ